MRADNKHAQTNKISSVPFIGAPLERAATWADVQSRRTHVALCQILSSAITASVCPGEAQSLVEVLASQIVSPTLLPGWVAAVMPARAG